MAMLFKMCLLKTLKETSYSVLFYAFKTLIIKNALALRLYVLKKRMRHVKKWSHLYVLRSMEMRLVNKAPQSNAQRQQSRLAN